MKDARGHGSSAKGATTFSAALERYAAHQHGILSSVPNAEGHTLYELMSRHAQTGQPELHSGLSKQDLLGMSV